MKREHINISALTPLQYIEKNNVGQQYIDTEFIPNHNTRVVCEFEISEYSTLLRNTSHENSARGAGAIFGSRYSGGNSEFVLFVPIFEKTTGAFYFNTQNYTFSYSNIKNTRFIIDANKTNWTLSTSGQTVALKSFSSTTYTCPLNLLLFNINAHSTYTGIPDSPLYGNENDTKLRIYSCDIYDNGAQVRQFRPYLNVGEAGMLDEINNVWYGNNGTGEFIYG